MQCTSSLSPSAAWISTIGRPSSSVWNRPRPAASSDSVHTGYKRPRGPLSAILIRKKPPAENARAAKCCFKPQTATFRRRFQAKSIERQRQSLSLRSSATVKHVRQKRAPEERRKRCAENNNVHTMLNKVGAELISWESARVPQLSRSFPSPPFSLLFFPLCLQR